MKQGECWCNSKDVEWYLWDEDHQEVLGLDGKNAMLRVRISPKQGRVGIPIDFCPYCGRLLVDNAGEPSCPENLNTKVVQVR